jgi:1-acyl-sn-glycerol-3-phosphate acyltransferase
MILFKYLQITAHILFGFYVVLVRFRFANQRQRDEHLRLWSKKLLKILGVKLEVIGLLDHHTKGVLYASNHISWLDIHVINAWRPMRFVAKKEVRQWPVFGWFAMQLNTLFIDRQRRGHSKNISLEMSRALGEGDQICIFPEGTSSDGNIVLEFKPNLFQAAIDAKVGCQPLAISYSNMHDGGISYGPAFIGDMGLIESMTNTIKAAPLKVTIGIADVCQNESDRKLLSEEAWQKINALRTTNN